MKLKLSFKNIVSLFLKKQMSWSASGSSSWCHLCHLPQMWQCVHGGCRRRGALLSLKLSQEFSRGIKWCVSVLISVDGLSTLQAYHLNNLLISIHNFITTEHFFQITYVCLSGELSRAVVGFGGFVRGFLVVFNFLLFVLLLFVGFFFSLQLFVPLRAHWANPRRVLEKHKFSD